VKTLENANIAAQVNVGKRFDGTDLKLALQTTVTARHYQGVSGGREDLQFQIGPTLTWAPPQRVTTVGPISSTFTLPMTFTFNQSTVEKSEYHGFVVMPTLTLSFTPKPQEK
jgi:hypothetical protein